MWQRKQTGDKMIENKDFNYNIKVVYNFNNVKIFNDVIIVHPDNNIQELV